MSHSQKAPTMRLWESKAIPANIGMSKRNWEEEAKRLSQTQELPLLSRTDMSKGNAKSLRDVELQFELWDHVVKKISSFEDEYDKKSWEPLVDQFRKLREGVYASDWSNGNYEFAILVYEWSINTSLKAHEFDELYKSLKGLIEELYPLRKDLEKPFFFDLYMLYLCCILNDKEMVLRQLTKLGPNNNKAFFVKQVVRCVFVTKDPVSYFRLYHQSPCLPYQWMMEKHHDTMRKRAVQILKKAYLSVPLDWAKLWLGAENESEVVPMIHSFANCIDRVDIEKKNIYFIKGNKKTVGL